MASYGSIALCILGLQFWVIGAVAVESPNGTKPLNKRGANISLPHLELGLLGGKKKREADAISGNQEQDVSISKRGVNVSAPGITDLQLLGGKKRDVGDNVLEERTKRANGTDGGGNLLGGLLGGVLGGRRRREASRPTVNATNTNRSRPRSGRGTQTTTRTVVQRSAELSKAKQEREAPKLPQEGDVECGLLGGILGGRRRREASTRNATNTNRNRPRSGRGTQTTTRTVVQRSAELSKAKQEREAPKLPQEGDVECSKESKNNDGKDEPCEKKATPGNGGFQKSNQAKGNKPPNA